MFDLNCLFAKNDETKSKERSAHHPLAGCKLNFARESIQVHDWWSAMPPEMQAGFSSKLAAFAYGVRSVLEGLPQDDRVVYVSNEKKSFLLHNEDLKSLISDALKNRKWEDICTLNK